MLAALAGENAGPPAVEIQLTGSFGGLRLINRGAAVRLSSTLKVERKAKRGWEDTGVTHLRLITRCASGPVPECVSLDAAATLQPLPWTGRYCASQCPAACDLDSPLPRGAYRFTASTCDGAHHFESPPFEKN